MLAFARIAFTAFLMLFLVSSAVLLFCPIAALLTTFVYLDQHGQMLDLNTNPLYSGFKKLWLLAVLYSVITWFVLLFGPFIR